MPNLLALTSHRGLSEGVLTLPPPPPVFLFEKDILPSMPCSLLVDILGCRTHIYPGRSRRGMVETEAGKTK